MAETVALRFEGGPLEGSTQLVEQFRWPPPESVAIKLNANNAWAIADVRTLGEEELQSADCIYNLDPERTSRLPDDKPDVVVRGATYTFDTKED